MNKLLIVALLATILVFASAKWTWVEEESNTLLYGGVNVAVYCSASNCKCSYTNTKKVGNTVCEYASVTPKIGGCACKFDDNAAFACVTARNANPTAFMLVSGQGYNFCYSQ